MSGQPDSYYRRRARELYAVNGQVEFASTPRVARAEGSAGAWVKAQVWVPDPPPGVLGVLIWLESKHPHTTPWLKVKWKPLDPAQAEVVKTLEEVLAGLGWDDPNGTHLQVAPRTCLDGTQERFIVPPNGTALFNSWTEKEAAVHLKKLYHALEGLGFTNLPWYRLGRADLL